MECGQGRGEKEWSVNIKYWRDVLLPEQRSERTYDWGGKERGSVWGGEVVINLMNVVTGSSICSS